MIFFDYSVLIYNYLLLTYSIAIGAIYLLLNVLSFKRILQYKRKMAYVDLNKIFKFQNFKPISVIVPAYNEENTIVDSIKSLLQLEYPEYQLIIVNDGSTDGTLEKMFNNFSIRQVSFIPLYKLDSMPIKSVYMSSQYPSLVVVDKANGGKADAINAGINISKNPLIAVIDADSILERDCLLKIVRPFMENENIVAVGGTIRVANGCEIIQGNIVKAGIAHSWLARFQTVEYLRAFLFGRNGFDVLNSVMIISGAFSCFSRDALIRIGGYMRGSVGEDMEIIVRMHEVFRAENPDTKITFIPDPVCWTEAPERLKILRSQRIRWQKGTIDSLRLHKKLLFNTQFGALGLIVFPYYIIFEMAGPVIEISGYFVFIFAYLFNFVSTPFAIAFLSVVIIYGMVLSILSVILEELSFKKYPNLKELFILFVAAVFENFGYRQLITWWRFKATIDYISGKRSWGKMEKKGFN
jgi:cellulose synthase/poly-beta-1,6-N-acetylglucosamine synthase-like glycosyltransferase